MGWFAHCDLDCFFVSVERLLDPSLNGVPVGAVGGGDPEGRRGIIISASYEARPYGVTTATPVFEAKALCPDIRLVPAYGPYGKKSVAVEHLLRDHVPRVVRRSIDEFDIPLDGWREHLEDKYGSLTEMARRVQMAVWGELGLPMSIGISANVPVAKIATDEVKPFGVMVVPPDKVTEFVADKDVDEIVGIADRMKLRLAREGIHTLGDLAELDPRVVRGKWNVVMERLCRCVRGEQIEPKRVDSEQKQMGHNRTFVEPSDDPDDAHAFLEQLGRQLCFRMRRDGYLARHLGVRLRLKNFDERGLETPIEQTNLDEDIIPVAHKMLEQLNRDRPMARSVGIWCTDLKPVPRQPSLFEPDEVSERERLTKTVDRAREKFGWDAVMTGDTLRSRQQHPLKRLSCAFNVRSQPDLMVEYPGSQRGRNGRRYVT